MSISQLCPYLMFNGTATQAIELYKSALGATVHSLERFGDQGGPDMKLPAEARDRVMHARLAIGPHPIMVSDTGPGMGNVVVGANVRVCLEFSDVDDMRRRFDALAAGGKVTLALQDMPWGATFGMLVDAHGVSWMFNHTKTQPGK